MERKRKGLIFPGRAFRAKNTAPGKVMKRRHILMVGLALCLALAMLAFAQKDGKKGDKGGFISVCVTFRDEAGDKTKPRDRIMS